VTEILVDVEDGKESGLVLELVLESTLDVFDVEDKTLDDVEDG